ncbi:MAG: class I SAM-dependent methyltransferase [Candidatus Thorarchaeota archaeon]
MKISDRIQLKKRHKKILESIPLRDEPPAPPNWLRLEVNHRFQVLNHILHFPINKKILEIGCGDHGITSMAITSFLGSQGKLISIDIANLREVHNFKQVSPKIEVVQCDALHLPFSKVFDMAITFDATRSFRSPKNITQIFQSMLEWADEIIIIATLPISETSGQKIHLDLFSIREELFDALWGVKADLFYFTQEELTDFLKLAGADEIKTSIVRGQAPHFLGYIPICCFEQIKDSNIRRKLTRRFQKLWKEAQHKKEEHPPCIILQASREK